VGHLSWYVTSYPGNSAWPSLCG